MPAAATIDFEKTLNPQQLAAVTHGDGPQLVIAGAGSGKTRVITYRVAWLVRERDVAAGNIAAVTFTNKAAAEMRERIESLLALHPLPTFVGTFHRFALRLLRAYGDRVGLKRSFAIVDSSDQLALVKKALKKEGLDERAFRPRSVLSAISGAKNRLVGPKRYEREADDFFRRRVAPAYRRYQRLLRESGGIDFDDMIGLAVKLLHDDKELRERIRGRFRHLLVDEFQDTNHAQLRLIHAISGAGGNLTAVGDEDQGIYRWRGAELENILRFEKGFPGAKIRKLERNYRSTQNILDAAGAVVAHNENRRGKTLWTDSGAGEKVVLYQGRDESDEARWIAGALKGLESDYRLAEMAVLVRTNAQTRALEEELLRRRIPYVLIGAIRFYERAEIKDLVAYLRFLRNPDDEISLGRILNKPPRGIGKTTQDQLQTLAATTQQTTWETLVADDLAAIGARGARALRRFRDTMAPLVDEAGEMPLGSLLQRLLDVTSYAGLYDKHDEEGRGKLENIDEFLSAAEEFNVAHGYTAGPRQAGPRQAGQAGGGDGEEPDMLTAFLDHVSLVSDTDSLGNRGGVSVMTLHSAKGLEFKAVIVAGLEEKLLPHMNAMHEAENLEEERRLLYVGMTRARERLFLTTCRRRMIAGTYQDQDPSRFLSEIPERFLEIERSPEIFSGAPGRRPRRGQARQANRTSQPSQANQASNVYAFFGQQSSPANEASSGGQAGLFDEPEAATDRPRRGGRLKRGARVLHAKLGRGRVLSIEGSGDDMRLTVYFDGTGRRKLVAKYANLQVF